jgi:hypothetical protein
MSNVVFAAICAVIALFSALQSRPHPSEFDPTEQWTATIHRPTAKKDRSPDSGICHPMVASSVDREDQALCTRVCEGTATILSIFVLQGSPAGHQLTAAYDG